MSVTGGTRIEIKGVPKIGMMPLLTYNEAQRQWNLLRLREELKRRGITEETFDSRSADVTRILKRTRFLPIADAMKKGQVVSAVCLPGWADLLRWQTQDNTVFSREISDRVRVIACLSVLPNIIHSDSMSETLSGAEWKETKAAVGCKPADSMVIVWGEPRDVETAVKEIIIRAKEATIGIPSETRQALRDGTTGFERILPGPQRMYPDTDLPPIRVTPERLARLRERMPVQYWDRVRRYHELKVPQDAIEGLAISPLAPLFEEAVTELGFDVTDAAVMLWRLPRRLRRQKRSVHGVPSEVMRAILVAVRDGKLTKDGVLDAMRRAENTGFDADALPPRLERKDLVSFIEKAKQQVRYSKLHDKNNIPNLTLDRVMDEVRGRIPGADVAAEVEAYFAKEAQS